MTTPGIDPRAPARKRRQERLLVAGLVGVVALTMTWWTMLACGLWMMIG